MVVPLKEDKENSMKTRKILCMTYRPGVVKPSINEEPCDGDCYEYDDVLDVRGEGWTSEQIRMTMTHLLGIHANICGNANYRLGVDLDENTNIFIGTFYRFGALDVVTGRSVQEVVEALAGATSTYFASETYSNDVARDAGLGRGACAHGDDTALKMWMAKVGGFDVSVLA